MPHVVKDRVMETTASTGTGTITLAGAVAGYQSFSVIGNGNTTYYTISGGTEWEVGIGTYTSSGTVLSRDTVLESSNGGSLVNFSAGTKNVFVTYPAEKSVDSNGNQATGTWSINITGNAATVTNGVYTTGSYSNPSWITSIDYSKLTGTVPTWNQNTTGNAATATNPQSGGTFITSSNIGSQSVSYAATAGSVGTADRAYEWKGSGNTGNWNTQFQDTEAQSATQIDINGGTNCPTGGGWWFAESFRHSNSSNYWGLQYAHGWEDRANQRWTRNVSSNNFAAWRLDIGCRAWINFNGQGTIAIRASGNVSSIADNGTGLYTVNFSVAMVDANYSAQATNEWRRSNWAEYCSIVVYNASSVQVRTTDAGSVNPVDVPSVFVAIFR